MRRRLEVSIIVCLSTSFKTASSFTIPTYDAIRSKRNASLLHGHSNLPRLPAPIQAKIAYNRKLHHDPSTSTIAFSRLNLFREDEVEDTLDRTKDVPFSSPWIKITKPKYTKLNSQEKETIERAEKESLQESLLRDMVGKGSTLDDISSYEGKKAKASRRAILPLKSLINVEALLLAGTSGEERDFGKSSNTTQKLQSMAKNNGKEKPSILREFSDWESFVQTLQKNVKDIAETSNPYSSSFPISMSTDFMLKEATQVVESLVNTTTFGPEKIQDMVLTASRMLAVDQSADVFKSTLDGIVLAAELVAKDRGLDVSEAAAQARANTKYTAEFLQSANGVLLSGYVKGGQLTGDNSYDVSGLQLESQLDQRNEKLTKPLFHKFKTATSVPAKDVRTTLMTGSAMAMLSGSIYQDISVTHELGHSVVANGTKANVAWMVTDSVGYESEYVTPTSDNNKKDDPILVRSITIRGFDASDDSVDREMLLNQICTANPVNLGDGSSGIRVHNGLYDVAKSLYPTIMKHIDSAGSKNKVVINGHSIGGSLSILILMIMTEERGAEFVNDKVLKVFTYGSPPIALVGEVGNELSEEKCSVLSTLGLRESMVYGYIQPWDPVIRLFSQIDACYPLIGDLGEDGVTLYASGPSRALRPITRAVIEAWEGWPIFRDNFQATMQQNYTSIGMQHLLLPDPGRYLTDRILNVNIATHPIEEVIRIAPSELYATLQESFPIDVFSISMVPAAIRSFVHHFYPAYGSTFVLYTQKRINLLPEEEIHTNDKELQSKHQLRLDWADEATKWILGDKFGT